jgi:26S proteasome regulatory subunit N7
LEFLKNLLTSKSNLIEFRELSNYIAQGRLAAKIDKVSGVIECTQNEPTVDLYHRTVRESDLLLNKIHRLSKLLEL